MKRVMLAAVLAAGVLVASAVGASACATYCDWDPLVLVVTPGGNVVPVYDSVWTSTPLDLGLPTETYTTQRVWHAGTPMTEVEVTIYVPAGLLFNFATYDQVTTGLLGSGSVLAGGWGTSGKPVSLKFLLPIA